MEIKVLGTGCAGCKTLYATVGQVVKNTAEARTAKVTLTMGEKIAEITVNQAAPFKADYNSYIGTWKVKGKCLMTHESCTIDSLRTKISNGEANYACMRHAVRV